MTQAATTTSQMVIRTRGLTKTFTRGLRRRKVRALDALDLDVRPGEIFGFLGHNGAGKSTAIKLLTGLIFPDAGEAEVAGAPAGSVRARARIGYLPENPVLGDAWKAREFLTMSAELAGMRGSSVAAEVHSLVERLGLQEVADRRLGKMSKGQTQLVGLAHAILGRPPLLILDEPMSGLDPMARKKVRDLLLELRAAGRSIFFSSHILADVELICDRVALVSGGKLAGIHSLDELRAVGRRQLEIVVRGVAAADLAARGAPVRDVREGGDRTVVCRLEDPAAINDLLGWMMSRGGTICSVTPRGGTLEDFVLTRIGGGAADVNDHVHESGDEDAEESHPREARA